MCQEEAFKKMSNILQKHNIKTDTVYLCNVRHFIEDSQQQKFANSITHILDDDTFVIHCPHILLHQAAKQGKDVTELPVKSQENSRRQSVTRGKDIKNNHALCFVRQAKNVHVKNKVEP